MKSDLRREAAVNEHLKSFETSRVVHIRMIEISNCSFYISIIAEYLDISIQND
jgi:hypothetical protein